MNSNVIIAGSGRSGTTWVLDSLADANHMRTVFEPLHPIGVPDAAGFAHAYIPTDKRAPEARLFMERVFSGRFSCLWTNYRIRPDRFNPLRNSPVTIYNHTMKSMQLLRAFGSRSDRSGQVVKFIRANLMLPWLAREFGHPIILVVRHPCAVVASRLKLSSSDWSAGKALDRYRHSEAICELINKRFCVDISRPMSAVAALASVWCIENVLPMEWAAAAGYAVVPYESLLVEPDKAWHRVTDHLGLASVPGGELLSSPSQQSSVDMRTKTFTPAHVERWKKELNKQARDEIGRVLDRFEVRVYNANDAMPASDPMPSRTDT